MVLVLVLVLSLSLGLGWDGNWDWDRFLSMGLCRRVLSCVMLSYVVLS